MPMNVWDTLYFYIESIKNKDVINASSNAQTSYLKADIVLGIINFHQMTSVIPYKKNQP